MLTTLWLCTIGSFLQDQQHGPKPWRRRPQRRLSWYDGMALLILAMAFAILLGPLIGFLLKIRTSLHG